MCCCEFFFVVFFDGFFKFFFVFEWDECFCCVDVYENIRFKFFLFVNEVVNSFFKCYFVVEVGRGEWKVFEVFEVDVFFYGYFFEVFWGIGVVVFNDFIEVFFNFVGVNVV